MHMHGSETLAPSTPPQKTGILENIAAGISTALSLINQQKIADLNIKRAKEGLPAVKVEQIPGAIPTAQVQVGMDTGTKQLLTFGALGLGAILLLNSRKRRR